jgi:hypothetical protein
LVKKGYKGTSLFRSKNCVDRFCNVRGWDSGSKFNPFLPAIPAFNHFFDKSHTADTVADAWEIQHWIGRFAGGMRAKRTRKIAVNVREGLQVPFRVAGGDARMRLRFGIK